MPLFHDATTGARCSTSAGRRRLGRPPRPAPRAEEAGEALRLLYVAITRAQSQVVTWWAPTQNTPASPLHRMLFGRGAGAGARCPTRSRCRSDDDVRRAVSAAWQERGGPAPELRRRRAELSDAALPSDDRPLAVRALHPDASTPPGGARRTPR